MIDKRPKINRVEQLSRATVVNTKSPYSRNSFLENSAVAPKKPTPAAASGGKKVFAVGDRVRHNVFGDGIVVKITPIANDSMLEITFETVGTKKVMANFAPVSKID